MIKVDLSNCEISSLEAGAFAGLNKLERLYLTDNHLAGVDQVEEVLPVIHELTLAGNPWSCDCKAKTFRHQTHSTFLTLRVFITNLNNMSINTKR